MDKYISVKRTKMIDEAAFGHKPRTLVNSIMVFILVYLISLAVSFAIQIIPTFVYIFGQTDFAALVQSMLSGQISQTEYTEAINEILNNQPSWLTLVSLLSTVSLIFTAIIYCKVIEKRKMPSMGLRKKNAVPEYLIGLAIGFVMFALAMFIAWMCKSVTISFNAETISPIIILFFIGFVIQGASEELIVRGYFMVSIARDYRVSIAIIFSSLAFALLHGGNSGFGILPFLNIFLFGVFMAVYIFKRGDIWGACAIHTMWNFTQGNIFGSKVSGMGGFPSVLITESNPDRIVANGGAFGLEGGVAVTIVLLVAIGISLVMKTKESELSDTERVIE